ncbi:YciI family protein [Sphingobium abikonense]|uniref:YciI family protein n=1 Tax=Sphingobium abikonense TaxID=86193 RepID=UPI0035119A9B
MFIISLTYTAGLEALEPHRPAHCAWLDQGIADGWMLLAGPRNPRDGGIILARGTRAELQEKAATDPFFQNGLSTFDLMEFNAVRAAAGVTLESLLA